jgi:hypothetical protein
MAHRAHHHQVPRAEVKRLRREHGSISLDLTPALVLLVAEWLRRRREAVHARRRNRRSTD